MTVLPRNGKTELRIWDAEKESRFPIPKHGNNFLDFLLGFACEGSGLLALFDDGHFEHLGLLSVTLDVKNVVLGTFFGPKIGLGSRKTDFLAAICDFSSGGLPRRTCKVVFGPILGTFRGTLVDQTARPQKNQERQNRPCDGFIHFSGLLS